MPVASIGAGSGNRRPDCARRMREGGQSRPRRTRSRRPVRRGGSGPLLARFRRMFSETVAAPRGAAASVGAAAARARELTVIVPAYNEAATIADTLLSLQRQTVPIGRIIVVDDCSADGTAEVARALGATVVRPPRNTGSKAGAQSFALAHVDSALTMAI